VAEPLVRASGLGKRYLVGDAIVHALSDVTVSIDAGDFVAVVGRSGSGKSTLLSILGLLERPDRGHYRLRGCEVGGLEGDARASIRSREIGFVFQMSALVPRRSAVENVELPLAYADVDRRERRRRAMGALDRVGMSHRRDHWPSQLSGGEQQRVAIARALVNDPTLILADEPTGALDSKTADSVMSLFEELNQDGRTIVVVTHAREVADRVRRRFTLHDGRIVESEHGPAIALASGAPG
jgi:putative ABC transport system ATP-binding protein